MHPHAYARATTRPLTPSHMHSKARPLSIGVVGFGKFGQFLAQRFIRQGHRVSCLSRSDRRAEAATLGVDYFGGLGVESSQQDLAAGPSAFLSQEELDVVVFAVSILSFEETVAQLPLEVLGARQDGALLVDVLSVKLHPRAGNTYSHMRARARAHPHPHLHLRPHPHPHLDTSLTAVGASQL